MTPERVQDLVYVYTNLRPLSRSTSQYKGRKKDVKSWGDEFETFEGPGIFEVANLSLDEPELEAVVRGWR